MKEKMTMNNFSKDLNQVLTFPSNIFVADNPTDKKINSFILSLAQAYNDFRDLQIISMLTKQDQNECDRTNNPLLGQQGGMEIFIHKLYFAYIFEFIKLIKDNVDTINDPSFKKIINKIDKVSKSKWEYLINFSQDQDGKIYLLLLKLRNNLAFHYYQPDKLYEGYKFVAENPKLKMYLSAGSSMKETRYYFIDCALQVARYRAIEHQGASLDEWKEESNNLAEAMLFVTMNIVRTFIITKSGPTVAPTEVLPNFDEVIGLT